MMSAYVSFLTAAGRKYSQWKCLISTNTSVFFFKLSEYCLFRNAFRDGSMNNVAKPAPVLAVKNERGFNLKMDVKNLGKSSQKYFLILKNIFSQASTTRSS